MKFRTKRLSAMALAGVLAVSCMPAGIASVYAADVEMKGNQTITDNDIVILYTNDVHNAYDHSVKKNDNKEITSVSCLGYTSLSWFKNQVEKVVGDDNCTLVDCGDSIQGSAIGAVSKGEYLVKLMNEVGYDYAIPGNHEFDFGMETFLNYAGVNSAYTGTKANYKYLSCNFTDLRKDNASVLDAYAIKEYTLANESKVKVAFVGVSTPETFTKSTPTYFQDGKGKYIYSFAEGEEGKALCDSVQYTVNAAKEAGADFVVALAHVGTDDSSEPYVTKNIISKTSGIDVYLDGHSHTVMKSDTMKNKDGKDVIVSSTGTKLANIGELVIHGDTLKAETSLVSNITATDETMDKYIEKEITAGYKSKVSGIVAKTDVDLITQDLTSKKRLIRSQETNLGDLCADAYKSLLDADCAIVNGGGIRADILKGDVTLESIINVHPYSNLACLAEVTGQQILDALELGAMADAFNSDGTLGESGGFLQVSGITYEIDKTFKSNVKLDEKKNFVSVDGARRVKNVKINGVAIDKDKKYKLASHNYALKSYGDGMTMFKGCKILADEVMVDNEVLSTYITKTLGGTVSASSIYANPYGEGRIKVIVEGATADYCEKILQGTSKKAIEHKWNEGLVTTKATATTEGVKTYTCKECGATKTEVIPKVDLTVPAKDVKDAEPGQLVETTDAKADYIANGDGTLTYKAPKNEKATKVTVPTTVKDAAGNVIKVTAIAAGAFKNNKKIKTVVIGNNIKTIGKNTFEGCTNLKSVTIGKNVTKIGSNAFKGAKKVKTITINSKKLTKANVKKCFAKSSVKTVKVASSVVKKYKKIFTKKNCGKKVTVKKISTKKK